MATLVAPDTAHEPWRAFDAEARQLTDALRSARLSALIGRKGHGKSTLLTAGVLPLLRRRAGDFPAPSEAAQVVHLADRRQTGRGPAELLFVVDGWNDGALATLDQALDESLVARRIATPRIDASRSWQLRLATVSRQHGGARLLFVFDHFEQLLETTGDRAQARGFIDGWLSALANPALNIRSLVALDEQAWPLLQARLRQTPVPELRAFRLRPRDGRQRLVDASDTAEPDGSLDAQMPLDEPSAPVFDQSIDAILSRTARSARDADAAEDSFDTWLDASLSKVTQSARETQAPTGPAMPELTLPIGAGSADAPARDAERIAHAARAAEAKRQAEAAVVAEARRLAEIEAWQRADAEARRIADEAARAAEAQRVADAARLAEAQRQAEAAALAETHRLAEIEARRHAEAEARRLEEEARQKAEAERIAEVRRQAAAAEARREAELEAKRRAEVEARRIAEEAARAAEVQRMAEAARLAEEKRQADAAAAAEARREAELEAKRRADLEARRIAEEATRAAEVQRVAEAARIAEEKRQAEAAAAAEARRLAELEAKRRAEVEARRIAEEAARAAQAQRITEAARIAAEEEARRQAEASARRVEAERVAEAKRQAEAAAAVEARRLAEIEAKRRVEAEREAEAVLATLAAEMNRSAASAATAERLPAALQAGASAGSRHAGDVERPAGAWNEGTPRRSRAWALAPLALAALVALWWWQGRQPSPTGQASDAVSGPLQTASAPSAEVLAPPASTPAMTDPGGTTDSARSAAPAVPAAPTTAAASTATPSPTAATTTAPAPTAPTTTARRVLQIHARDGSAARIAQELARALGSGSTPFQVTPAPAAADPMVALRTPGSLAIVRQDDLRAARRNASAPALQVLTPLYTEPVRFVVRADSPLRFVHDLRGRRIDIGDAKAGAAGPVRDIYRQMFGTAMPTPTRLGGDAALAELVGFRSIDAVALVDGPSAQWLGALDARTARGLRVLRIDPRHPVDRKALQAFGTADARSGVGARRGERVPAVAVTSFLVASGRIDNEADIAELMRTLCSELPRLRAEGHPRWRELDPSRRVDTGWPVLASAQSALSACVPKSAASKPAARSSAKRRGSRAR